MHTKIYFSDDTFAHFEDILSCIPQTYFLYVYHSCYFSSKTENLLPLIERKQKFSNLTLLYIEGDIDIAKLYEFIVKNIQPRSTVDVSFNNDP
uniref:DUF4435 domain-containing protein n=1 Tax=Panagrolaimus sp. PS1159 TaxID=55785 RepID=A0AC35GV33_9BILA